IARKAADYLLEHAIDNHGKLCRIIAGGKPRIEATLEDYANLIKGLISLWRANPDAVIFEAATSLFSRADELFCDRSVVGYFFKQGSENLLVRIKSGDDAAVPNANAIMLENMIQFFEITKDQSYREKAEKLAAFFLSGNTRVLMEFATMLQGALYLDFL